MDYFLSLETLASVFFHSSRSYVFALPQGSVLAPLFYIHFTADVELLTTRILLSRESFCCTIGYNKNFTFN